eukprot:scaffold519_cov30-Tisochrysis_lutea.AAC.3
MERQRHETMVHAEGDREHERAGFAYPAIAGALVLEFNSPGHQRRAGSPPRTFRCQGPFNMHLVAEGDSVRYGQPHEHACQYGEPTCPLPRLAQNDVGVGRVRPRPHPIPRE